MRLFDTHCHIHEATFGLKGDDATRDLWLKAGSPDPDDLIREASEAGVVGMICVGTTPEDSKLAVEFVRDRPGCWASVGVHPHEAKRGIKALRKLKEILAFNLPRGPAAEYPHKNFRLPKSFMGDASLRVTPGWRKVMKRGTPSFRPPATTLGAIPSSKLAMSLVEQHRNSVLSGAEGGQPAARNIVSTAGGALSDEAQDTSIPKRQKIVAIGECGLDYFYNHSPKEDQIKALRFQIELALEHNLPLIFHVREAFDDFWRVLKDYKGVRGVAHSFTDTMTNLNKVIEHGLHAGINGIITFTKNDWQLDVVKATLLEHLLLETDAPFLTPEPLRGRVNAPVNVRVVAKFLAELRAEDPKVLAEATTRNAFKLFNLS